MIATFLVILTLLYVVFKIFFDLGSLDRKTDIFAYIIATVSALAAFAVNIDEYFTSSRKRNSGKIERENDSGNKYLDVLYLWSIMEATLVTRAAKEIGESEIRKGIIYLADRMLEKGIISKDAVMQIEKFRAIRNKIAHGNLLMRLYLIVKWTTCLRV